MVAAATAMMALGACVPEGMMMATSAAPAASAAPATADATEYAARADNGFSVPAIPVDQVPPQYLRQTVAYTSDFTPGTIVIDPSQKVLYYVTGPKSAVRYGIAVGKEGFGWSGEANVAEKKLWPTWTPPKEMIARKPELAKWEKGQPGGPTNPLGARAIYLNTNGVDYGYRIHGTPEWKSIGSNASSGCIRMFNQDVIDLYGRVQGGERVIVLTSTGEMPTKLTLPPKPKAATPKPAAPAAVEAPAATPELPPLPAMLPPPVFTTTTL
ncbi:L,D-transpeptidase [Neotabrizicola shimadae]|uniref:L,D-transpeptidase n=2 Tax=Neotabrizicola shimadae TaxID=2807096 RepID=A0A8G1EFB4_9RHOB|nr:L,D-transpeptidase [Neotabrizicola shimadae]